MSGGLRDWLPGLGSKLVRDTFIPENELLLFILCIISIIIITTTTNITYNNINNNYARKLIKKSFESIGWGNTI